MSIFDSLRVAPTGVKWRDTISGARTIIEVSEPTAVGFHGFGEVNEYALRLGVEQVFRANRAQFDHARAAALKVAANYLYADVQAELQCAALAVFGGDAEGALQALDRAKKAMTP